ncbi:class I SAM-dependent RNA methyltransferase [Corynebacterium pelargi]|uniref:Putative RNA methyltransferase n=1 Tax=Corynebacterium pelargi TaxID=1471400 RepID=A0A410W8G6_9CORY|nr:TRAM domain-containing protein [Corynebacterium pelargi]QAU52243.1 putative RNA methyltransferase [Corynebacterium pelargi]GGG69138.1 putative RNA methyltransferase Cgl1903/cg2084 [Corynebacterium pelargi]
MTHSLAKGQSLELEITDMAYGGEGIAHLDGRVVFVRGALPGDHVRAECTQVKKRFAKASVVEVIQPSPMRTAPRCDAAAAGAGCCDFAAVDPAKEAELKRDVVLNQLSALAGIRLAPEHVSVVDFEQPTGWRTRMRLGSDAEGKIGMRRARSSEIVPDQLCAQAVPELQEALAAIGTVTPGAEVVAARDGDGAISVVEIRKAARGRRRETIERTIQGSHLVREHIGDATFTVPSTAFWQAHEQAVPCYSEIITTMLQEGQQAQEAEKQPACAWDLYGGVGAFAPAIAQALPEARIHSVEASRAAAAAGKKAFGKSSLAGKVEFHTGDVAKLLTQLPRPAAVVLDPPRTGAGQSVIADIANAQPSTVVHIGCDAATFARDLGYWQSQGYGLDRLVVVDAFPGTHHCECVALITPTESAASEQGDS